MITLILALLLHGPGPVAAPPDRVLRRVEILREVVREHQRREVESRRRRPPRCGRIRPLERRREIDIREWAQRQRAIREGRLR